MFRLPLVHDKKSKRKGTKNVLIQRTLSKALHRTQLIIEWAEKIQFKKSSNPDYRDLSWNSSNPPVQKELEKNLKKHCYWATKFSLLPKARWAEMGSIFQEIPLPITQSTWLNYMFEWYYSTTFLEGKGVRGSLRGSRADPRKWPFLLK